MNCKPYICNKIFKRMLTPQQVRSFLSKYLPEAALSLFSEMIANNNLSLRITRNRKTKLGSFVLRAGKPPLITINYGLAPMHFAIVLAHELAHFMAWHNNKKRRIAPHGQEWKNEFAQMLIKLLELNIFTNEVAARLANLINTNFASPNAEFDLNETLRLHEAGENNITFLKDIEVGETFTFRNATFIKLENRRTRCIVQRTDDTRKSKFIMHLLLEVNKKEKV